LQIFARRDMERDGSAELDLAPFEIGDLARAQAVAIADEDQRRVSMAVAASAGRADEFFDLGRRQSRARRAALAGRRGTVLKPLRGATRRRFACIGAPLTGKHPFFRQSADNPGKFFNACDVEEAIGH
jgi:hypothetical protein